MLAKVGRRVGSRLQHIFIIVYLQELKSLTVNGFDYYVLLLSQNFKLTFLEGQNLAVACDNRLLSSYRTVHQSQHWDKDSHLKTENTSLSY